tara:strand:+ start:1961 stop:2713 length:753 start_codon:yes stop_codon:yes gene_type:complete
MNPHVYILILNWNGKSVLEACIDSVLKIDYSNYTILVIDNNSSDGSGNLVKVKYPNIEYLQLDKNYGFAEGYNQSFKYLKNKKTEFILLLNNDTEVDSDILKNFIIASNYYGQNNIFGGKIFYKKNPQKIWYAGGKVNLKMGYIAHVGIRRKDSYKYSIQKSTDYVTGCCLFTSMEIIDKLDGFDTRFNMYGEDVDICLRARQKDVRCIFLPKVILWHHVSSSIGGNFSLKKNIKKIKSYKKLIFKHILN